MRRRRAASGISRRRFLRAAAAGAAVAAAGAACGEGKRRTIASTPAPTPTASREPAVSRGGILRAYNLDATVQDTLDPHLTQMGPVVNMHSAVFSKLLRYEDEVEGTIAPDLADGMPEQPDGETYIVRLRRGVRFHDTPAARTAYPTVAGRELTAEDVKYSIERQLNRNSPQAGRFYRAGNWTAIERMELRDAHTLVFRMKEPVAPFAAFLAGRHAFVIARETVDGRDEANTAQAMLGSGPFMLDAFQSQAHVKLRRNPLWFARDDQSGSLGGARPFLDGYDAYWSPQEDVFQKVFFERRAVDTTGFLEPAALDLALKTNLADITLGERDAGGILASRLLTDRAPFKDDRVRHAVHLAVDRWALGDLLYPPREGEPSAKLSGPIAPAMRAWALPDEDLARRPGYRADSVARDEDLRTAKQLWAAALGDTPGVQVQAFLAGVPRTLAERATPVLQRQFMEAFGAMFTGNVDVSGHALIASALDRNVEAAAEGVVPFTFMFEDGGVDLDDWLYPYFHSGQPGNSFRLQDATLDGMLERSRREFDVEARRQLGLDIQNYLLANVNARIEYVAPVDRRLTWGYVRNSHQPAWYGSDFGLADTWLDTRHPAWAGRPA